MFIFLVSDSIRLKKRKLSAISRPVHNLFTIESCYFLEQSHIIGTRTEPKRTPEFS